MTRRVDYSPRTREQLTDLYAWIADESGFSDRAENYVVAILDYRGDLATFPFIGVARDDLRPGSRTLGFRKRVVIAFAVVDEAVDALGIYYGGRDYESLIAAEVDERLQTQWKTVVIRAGIPLPRRFCVGPLHLRARRSWVRQVGTPGVRTGDPPVEVSPPTRPPCPRARRTALAPPVA